MSLIRLSENINAVGEFLDPTNSLPRSLCRLSLLDRIAWRNLVGVSHTVDEVKAMAEEVEYEDGPNDEGEMFQRP